MSGDDFEMDGPLMREPDPIEQAEEEERRRPPVGLRSRRPAACGETVVRIHPVPPTTSAALGGG